jgi:hypothetical protein
MQKASMEQHEIVDHHYLETWKQLSSKAIVLTGKKSVETHKGVLDFLPM